jgi:hypothetical protein
LEEAKVQAESDKAIVKKQPTRRKRRVKTAPTNPTRLAIDTPPDVVRERRTKPIPRFSQWVVREPVVWAHSNIDGGSYLYEKGMVIDVVISEHEEPRLFDYSREFWFPEGMTVIDPRVDRVLPRQMEPLNFDCLVDPKHVNYARHKIPTKKKFDFRSEVDDPKKTIESMPEPEPLDPQELIAPKEAPQVFNPTDPSKRPGMTF